MRAATERAAMRRGCVWPMRARLSPRPVSSSIFGSCVVLPEPVSPQTMTTGCAVDGARISSRRALIGSASSKVILKLPAVSEEPLQVTRDQVDLEVYFRTCSKTPERGDLQRVRNKKDLERIALDLIHC